MRLTVLGGSAAGGNTGAGCSGFLVQTDQTSLVLDLGPGTLLELRKHTDFRLLDGIVISHLHVDHILDLAALRYALAYNPVKPTGRIPLWLPTGGTAFLDSLGAALDHEGKAKEFFHAVFDMLEYDPSGSLAIEDTELSFAPTVHYLPCWAMRVSARGPAGDLLYTADTGPAANLGPFAAGSAVVVAEATWIDRTEEPFATRGHQTAGEAAELARDANAESLVLTHMWEEIGFDAYRQRAAQNFDGRIELARPGLTVEW